MDKAVIVGVYGFIGYQLCESLLHEGVEVYGVHIPTDTTEAIVDEKRLLIGRNSNFTEVDETYLTTLDCLEENNFIFYDYYSFYMARKEDIFIQKVQSCLQRKHDSVAILPIQKLGIDDDDDQVQNLLQCKYRFFLPSIYGPWQPSTYFFSKALSQPNGDHLLEIREWTNDILYVEDAVRSILKEIEANNLNSILLKSNIENHWQKIALELGQQIPSIHQHNLQSRDDIQALEVKGTPYKEGIQRQKKFIIKIHNHK